MEDLISRLSEIRSKYNCFDENEEPYYRALSEAIKILYRREDRDTISRQAAIDAIKEFHHGAAKWRDEQEECSDIWHRADSAIASALEIGLRVKKLPSAQQWITCGECVNFVDHRCIVAQHHVSEQSDCSKVFGAKRAGES